MDTKNYGLINMAELEAICNSTNDEKVNAFAEAYCKALLHDLLSFAGWKTMEHLFEKLSANEKAAVIKKVDWSAERIMFPQEIAQVEGDSIYFSINVYDILGINEKAIPYGWKSEKLTKEYKAKVSFL